MSKLDIILFAAKSLFQKYGFRKVSVEDIVKEAGVSKATFYRYYDNKEDIAVKAVEDLLNEDRAVFLETISDGSLSINEKIRKLISLKEQVYRNRSELFFEELDHFSPQVKAVIYRFRDSMTTELRNFLIKAKNDGALRENLNLDLVSRIISFLFEEGLRNNRFAGTANRAEFVREVSELIFFGILKKAEE